MTGPMDSRQGESGVVPPQVYEYGHREAIYRDAHEALEAACVDALAAVGLGLRVLVEPIQWRAFRGDGNVNKVHCTAYRLSFPSEARDLESANA
jgi:hypothetical protein